MDLITFKGIFTLALIVACVTAPFLELWAISPKVKQATFFGLVLAIFVAAPVVWSL